MKKASVNEFEKERQKFVSYLKSGGFRLTMGRECVLKVVLDTHGHFSCEDLVKKFKDHTGNVSRATIYRTIAELLEAQVIRQTAFGKKHNNYEHLYDEKPHHHARCIRCSQIIEFQDLGEDKMYQKVLIKKGFKILGHEMHFYGICQKCQNS